MTDESNHSDERAFARRALIAVGIVSVTVVVLLVLRRLIDVIMIVFAGTLAAIVLSWLASQASQRLPIGRKTALVGILLLLTLAIVGGGWLAASPLVEQADQLAEGLRQSSDELLAQVEQNQWLADLWQQLQEIARNLLTRADFLSQFSDAFSVVSSALAGFLIILVVGVYFAYDPALYSEGMLRLVPPDSRERARAVLANVAEVLRWWLLGRFASMVILGVLWTIGLWLLGMPLVLLLGVLATVLAFVPYLGAILTLLPVLVLALADSPQMALYVLLLYAGVQALESYLLTPLVQQRAISLPPVITLTSQVVMGLLLGFYGVVLAPALAATLIVLVKMLYVQDLLGDTGVDPVPDHGGS